MEGENAEEQDKSCGGDVMSSSGEETHTAPGYEVGGRRLETLSTIAPHSNFFFRSSILADRVQLVHPRPRRGCPCYSRLTGPIHSALPADQQQRMPATGDVVDTVHKSEWTTNFVISWECGIDRQIKK